MRPCVSAIGLVFAVALAGCAPQPVITVNRVHSNVLIPSHFSYAARAGKVEVTLRGNPFSGSAEALAEATLRAMKHAHAGPPTDFVIRPSASSEIYRLVYVFDADPLALARKACENPEAVALKPAGGGVVRLFGIFCQRETPLSEAMAAMDGVTTAESPAFAHLVAGLTLALLPHVPPDGGVYENPR
jgi:hypothetical protein